MNILNTGLTSISFHNVISTVKAPATNVRYTRTSLKIRQISTKKKGNRRRDKAQSHPSTSTSNENPSRRVKFIEKESLFRQKTKGLYNNLYPFGTREKLKATLIRFPLFLVCYSLFPLQIASPIGPSMLPTIEPRGEIFLIDRFFFRFLRFQFIEQSQGSQSLDEGDIVLFRKPTTEHLTNEGNEKIMKTEGRSTPIFSSLMPKAQRRVIKRIISVGRKKDTEGKHENQCRTSKAGILSPKPHQGYVWVEGDNLEMSTDSRHYGPIKIEDIEGKVVMRLWPLNKLAMLGKDQPTLNETNIEN